ncbi:hypothetical protein [Streptomyces canus]|uniref:hypothetical protein n=1 Tax=Streptomyces canus TaxID=58343 RepID=UPI002E316687|nr:hypothetical protein [Streptomyces canus]
MSQSIRRNWHKRIAAIKAAARFCKAYDSATGNMVNVEPARAFEAWESRSRATLSEDAPAVKWTVHVHSNSFFYLYAEDPDAVNSAPSAAAEKATERPVAEVAESERLDRARRGEQATRPTTAVVYVSPIMHTASVRFTDAEGRTANPSDIASLPGTRHTSPMADDLLDAAFDLITKRGFAVKFGAYWDQVPDQPDRARVAIVPTPAYLAYVERRFGPEPAIPETAGVVFTRKQRGRWEATASDDRVYALTWSPAVEGDTWRVWGGPQFTDLIRSTKQLGKALFVLKYPAHARV